MERLTGARRDCVLVALGALLGAVLTDVFMPRDAAPPRRDVRLEHRLQRLEEENADRLRDIQRALDDAEWDREFGR